MQGSTAANDPPQPTQEQGFKAEKTSSCQRKRKGKDVELTPDKIDKNKKSALQKIKYRADQKAKNEGIQEENRVLKGEAERLRGEVTAFRNLVAELQLKLNELNDRTNNFGKQMNKAIRKEKDALTSKVKLLEGELEAVKKENKLLEQLTKSQEETVKAHKNLVAELQQKLNELNVRTNEFEKQMIMDKLDKVENCFGQLFPFLVENANSLMHDAAASQIQTQPHATIQDIQMPSTELMSSQIPSNSLSGPVPLTSVAPPAFVQPPAPVQGSFECHQHSDFNNIPGLHWQRT